LVTNGFIEAEKAIASNGLRAASFLDSAGVNGVFLFQLRHRGGADVVISV